MIFLDNVYRVNADEFDDVWAIVRSPGNKIKNFKWVPELSPSSNLFGKFRELKDKKLWNRNSFNDIYVPQFVNEMKAESARTKLNELYTKSKAGKKICLVCFCYDEYMCHRSIVAGLLQGVGCDVRVNNDYSKYYDMYIK